MTGVRQPWEAQPLDEEEPAPLFDPEDIPLTERVCVARAMDVVLDGRQFTSQTFPLAVGIDASRWVTAELVVLIHRSANWTSVGIDIEVRQIQLTPDDPAEVFKGESLATVRLYPATATPALEVASFTATAPQLAVELEANQDFESSVSETVTISIYLIGHLHRPPDPRAVTLEPETDGTM